MKQVKILKRPPAQPPTPPSASARVSSEITKLLEACMARERARLEATYRARQDNLLRCISVVLNDSLDRIVSTAVQHETEALVTSFAKLATTQSQALAKADAAAQKPDPDPEALVATRTAFATAFENAVLPAFEKAIASMLSSLASTVESQVEERLVNPAGQVVKAIETAADSMRAAKGAAEDFAVDSEAADLAQVQQALDANDVHRALMLSVGKSVKVQAKAVSGVLDTTVSAEQAFEGGVPSRSTLVGFAALLAMDLADRTEARLSWLYEVVTLMDDADEYDQAEPELIDTSRRHLMLTIEKLSDFQANVPLGGKEAKHVKLLIRVLKTHLSAM